MVLEGVLISFFYMQLSFFPAPLTEETIFSPLYILASLVKDWLTIYVWVYFWAFYPVPMIYISVSVPIPYSFDYCSFRIQSEVRDPDNSSSVFLSQDCIGYFGVFCILIPLFFFCLFRAAPRAYANSQARSQIRTVSAGLYHSHSNARSERCL